MPEPGRLSTDPRPARRDERCTRCFGTRWVVVAGRGARRCDACHPPQRIVRVGETPASRSLDDMAGHVRPASALRACRRFVKRFPDDGWGLLISGPKASGKTALALAILRTLEPSLRSGAFVRVADLVATLAASAADRERERAFLAPILGADILVLDDLGVSAPSATVFESLAYVINSRYTARRATVVTTSFVDTAPANDIDSLAYRIGSRLYSRLVEMCRPLRLAERVPPTHRPRSRSVQSTAGRLSAKNGERP